jgi:hypothetical protein
LVEPYPSIPSEFKLSLDGVWRDLLCVFSGDSYDPLEPDHLAFGNEGVWAVRGRHLAYPLLESPGLPEAEHLNEVRLMFNDGDDIDRIVGWLQDGPTEEFLAYFKANHEAYVDGMIEEGVSEEDIKRYAGGGREATPYIGHWNHLLDFYVKSQKKCLFVSCYIEI